MDDLKKVRELVTGVQVPQERTPDTEKDYVEHLGHCCSEVVTYDLAKIAVAVLAELPEQQCPEAIWLLLKVYAILKALAEDAAADIPAIRALEITRAARNGTEYLLYGSRSIIAFAFAQDLVDGFITCEKTGDLPAREPLLQAYLRTLNRLKIVAKQLTSYS